MAWCQSGIIYILIYQNKKSEAAHIVPSRKQPNPSQCIQQKFRLKPRQRHPNINDQRNVSAEHADKLKASVCVRLEPCEHYRRAVFLRSPRSDCTDGFWTEILETKAWRNSRTEKHINFCSFFSFLLLFKALLVTSQLSRHGKGA